VNQSDYRWGHSSTQRYQW